MKTMIKLLSTSAFLLILNSCGGVPEEKTTAAEEEKAFAVAEVLEMVAKENDVTRTLYTKAIVGGGKKQGMKFDEDWRKDDVEAGPLPALFLRGIATSIRKSPVPLGLYLGSDFPVNAANKFEGKQAELFTQIKKDQKPQFFYDESQKLHTAMFADLASAGACVSCHNDHPQTSKSDWKLGDVMGATTWQYPKDSLTYKETVAVLNSYAQGTVDIYMEYLDEIEAFETSEKPEIGDKWPADGNYLPTPEVFLDSVRKLSSYETMKHLVAAK
ncbi:MAG: c-type heme family protein [Jejuia sp.]